jgi:hypothetical protein
MIIKPPNEYGIPEPKLLEFHDSTKDWEENRRIQLYLDIKPWLCPECGGKMFGRVLACVFCKFRRNKHVPRPLSFKKERRDG